MNYTLLFDKIILIVNEIFIKEEILKMNIMLKI